LDLVDREKLKSIALERLLASADDDEQWSFLFRTKGAVSLLYRPWSVTEHWEFDGETEGLELPWPSERLNLITRGEADPREGHLPIAFRTSDLNDRPRLVCKRVIGPLSTA
jgi:hypothetical protein